MSSAVDNYKSPFLTPVSSSPKVLTNKINPEIKRLEKEKKELKNQVQEFKKERTSQCLGVALVICSIIVIGFFAVLWPVSLGLALLGIVLMTVGKVAEEYQTRDKSSKLDDLSTKIREQYSQFEACSKK